jgi:hypothetical protein
MHFTEILKVMRLQLVDDLIGSLIS